MSKGLKTGVTGLAALLGLGGIVFTLLAVQDPFSSKTDIALGVSYVLMGLCALIAIGAGLYAAASNIGKNKKVLIGLIGVAVIFALGYALASGTIEPKWEGMEINESISKLSGMGVIASYVFAGLAVFSIAFFEIKNAFK
ncbi:MAG: hypothetical protein HKN39_01975 [Flavobacteriales bacterium]|nr:hypothetical protein [Flavobacteriales bacterium]